MRYASVCSGVEAASLAWMPIGWEAAWFSEIEPFPCAVLKERFPVVPNLGDMTKIKVENLQNGDQRFTSGNGADVFVPGGVDLLVGGTPCQGFSVAGKQDGLDDPRSVLCLTYVRLLDEMRPRWFVWENVPGVFSTNGGEDFKAFLRSIDEIGYSLAWRVLDAQYVRVDGYPRAVPQRRRRVFVVGHLGEWQYPASVLFEPDCLFGDNPPRRIKGKGFAAGFAGGPGTASGIDGYNGTVTGNISATVDGHCKLPNGSNLVGRLWDASGVNPTLNQCNAGSGIIGASNQELFSQNANGLVMEVSPMLDASYPGHLNHQDTGKLVIDNAKFWNGEDVSTTLTEAFADDRMPDKGKLPCVITESGRGFYSESAVGQTLEAHEDQHRRNIICRATRQGNAENMTDCCPTITEAAGTSGNNQPIICAGFCQGASPAAGSIGYHEQVSPTIKAGESGTAQVPALLCVHGSQDPIVNSDHANAIGRNQGAENCVCQYGDVAGSLTARHDSSPCADRGMNVVCMQQNTRNEVRLMNGGGQIAGALSAEPGAKQQNYVCFNPQDSQTSRIYGTNGSYPSLSANNGGGQDRSGVLCYENHMQDSRVKPCGECSPQINAKAGTGGGNLPLVQAVAIAENVIGRKVENGGNGIGAQEELAYTQNTSGVMGVCTSVDKGGIYGLEPHKQPEEVNDADAKKRNPVEILSILRKEIGEENFRNEIGRLRSIYEKEVLQSTVHGDGVRCKADNNNGKVNMSIPCTEDCPIYDMRDVWCGKCNGCSPQGQGFYEQCSGELNASMSQMSQSDSCKKEDVCNMRNTAKGTWLLRKALGKIQEIRQPASVQTQSVRHDTRATVRKLLVVEAERLMGFPDNHTRIPWKGKPESECPDSPRYKACGNSMCVNVMRWIGMRIELVERKQKENSK